MIPSLRIVTAQTRCDSISVEASSGAVMSSLMGSASDPTARRLHGDRVPARIFWSTLSWKNAICRVERVQIIRGDFLIGL